MSIIYDKIKNDESFCFVRINDGEADAIVSNFSTPSRGEELSSTLMSEKLLNIISDNFIHDNLFIGVPCVLCYNNHNNIVMNEISKNRPITFTTNNIVDANILINSNYNKTFNLLIDTLSKTNRPIIVIASENAIINIDRLKKLFPINAYYSVTSKHAFNNCYDTFKDMIFEDNTFIITLCGPLGRILSYEWYKNNTTLSCLDLGSFFDPILQNKSYYYHTNTFKYCKGCYPTSDKGFTDIFKFCEGYVSKECYYLNTINEHTQIYNNDYNRIINNTKIRLEKETSHQLHQLMTYCKEQLLIEKIGDNKPNEGYVFEVNNQVNDLILFCHSHSFKNILEIGFLSGSSSVLFLENTKANVTSIDIKCPKYSEIAKEFIDEEYPNRHNLIIGNSSFVVQSLKEKYDLIFIDGCHSYELTLSDIVNCYYVKDNDAYVIIDDVVTEEASIASWTIGTTRAYEKCIEYGLIWTCFIKTYKLGRGNVICKYNNKDVSNLLLDISSNPYIYTSNIINNLVYDKNTFNKIYNHILELKLISEFSVNNLPMSVDGYIFQLPDLCNDLIDICNNINPVNILDIGFLYGSSSLLFLSTTNANVTSIEINNNNTIKFAEKYLKELYPSRFNLIYGSINDNADKLNTVYDIIFIDYQVTDITMLFNLIHDNTVIIMNDVVTDSNKSNMWSITPTNTYNHLLNDYNVNTIFNKIYFIGKGLVAFTIKKKI